MTRAETLDHLYRWLEDDRDRRHLKVRADSCDLWWVSLWIDEHMASCASGNDLDEVLDEALAGMVLWTPPPGETELA